MNEEREKLKANQKDFQKSIDKSNTRKSNFLEYSFPSTRFKQKIINEKRTNILTKEINENVPTNINQKYINCNSTTSSIKSYYKLEKESDCDHNTSYNTINNVKETQSDYKLIYIFERNIAYIKYIVVICCVLFPALLIYVLMKSF